MRSGIRDLHHHHRARVRTIHNYSFYLWLTGCAVGTMVLISKSRGPHLKRVLGEMVFEINMSRVPMALCETRRLFLRER